MSIKFYKQLLIVFSIILLNTNAFGLPDDTVLMIVQDREITRDEFLYHFHKSYSQINKNNTEEFLKEFIDLQLKLTQAREERLHHNIGFINELAEYRLILSSKYLTDTFKQREFVYEALERFKYELSINEIVVKGSVDFNKNDTLNEFLKAVEIRKRLISGQTFEDIALSFSNDKQLEFKPHSQKYISAFETEYVVESAIYHLKINEYSNPVKSATGYHIIQLIDKRISAENQKSEQEIIDLIKEAKDERIQIIKNEFVKKLKIEWNLTENPAALERICQSADKRIYKGNWMPDSKSKFNDVLVVIDGKQVLQNNFIDYMQDFETKDTSAGIHGYIRMLYNKFVSDRLIQYENLKLPEKYPEFKFQYEEYRDAILLLQITKQNVWLKAENDKQGLENFFNENKKKYISENNDKVSIEIVYNVVLSDYQEYLMAKWIAELQQKYKVQIFEDVLKSIY